MGNGSLSERSVDQRRHGSTDWHTSQHCPHLVNDCTACSGRRHPGLGTVIVRLHQGPASFRFLCFLPMLPLTACCTSATTLPRAACPFCCSNAPAASFFRFFFDAAGVWTSAAAAPPRVPLAAAACSLLRSAVEPSAASVPSATCLFLRFFPDWLVNGLVASVTGMPAGCAAPGCAGMSGAAPAATAADCSGLRLAFLRLPWCAPSPAAAPALTSGKVAAAARALALSFSGPEPSAAAANSGCA